MIAFVFEMFFLCVGSYSYIILPMIGLGIVAFGIKYVIPFILFAFNFVVEFLSFCPEWVAPFVLLSVGLAVLALIVRII